MRRVTINRYLDVWHNSSLCLGPTRATKIRQLLGEDAPERYIEIANADSKPWYLRSEHNKDEIVLNPDGGIRAGTMKALVERLTTHEYSGKSRDERLVFVY